MRALVLCLVLGLLVGTYDWGSGMELRESVGAGAGHAFFWFLVCLVTGQFSDGKGE